MKGLLVNALLDDFYETINNTCFGKLMEEFSFRYDYFRLLIFYQNCSINLSTLYILKNQ